VGTCEEVLVKFPNPKNHVAVAKFSVQTDERMKETMKPALAFGKCFVRASNNAVL
jgi:hypothetical protein